MWLQTARGSRKKRRAGHVAAVHVFILHELTKVCDFTLLF